MKFDSLNLNDTILRAVKSEGYEIATPIQVQAIPHILAGRDILACAQTGTGKTAAFALPILQHLTKANPGAQPGMREIRVLVLTPTRELASQIATSFSTYGHGLPHRNMVVFGGVGQKAQVRELKKGIDILVATPGRLLDLMQQNLIHFRGLQILVLDEADRMLDMGFIHDVRRIIAKLPRKRQTLFFSATMPPEIRKLSEQILSYPVRIEVTPVASTVEKIAQSVYHVEKRQKTSLLVRLLENPEVKRALVFTRTKRDANRVAEALNHARIQANAIHGNKSQGARERALDSIKRGQCRALVATDIAARGIDIDQVTHVFNHDIPNISETYVHRIGRTARAGTEGSAVSLCATEEKGFLNDIERLIRKKISVVSTPAGLEIEAKGSGGLGQRSFRRKQKSGGSLRPQFLDQGDRSQYSSRDSRKGNPRAKPHTRPHPNPNSKPDNRRQRRAASFANHGPTVRVAVRSVE